MFCDTLESLIKSAGCTKAQLCRGVRISRPYLYAVLSGESKPPTYEVQIRMADYLRLEAGARETLYDEAAKERGEVPADIMYYFQSSEHIAEFRRSQLPHSGEQE